MVALVPDKMTVTVATPVASTGVVASVLLPEKNVTFPVGPVAGALPTGRTTEISVSCCPPSSEVAEAVSTSVVERGCTTRTKGADPLGMSRVSPA